MTVNVTLQLRDTGEDVEVELPGVPRVGEEVLWCDESTDSDGAYDRLREYRVAHVSWTLSRSDTPYILVFCDFVGDKSGEPEKIAHPVQATPMSW